MRRIENCELNEWVRPVLDGWYDDGGSIQMFQSQEYYVRRFYPDPKGRLHQPYSFVKVTDGVGLDYVLNYGRMVIGRLEPPPSLSEIAAMPPEFWVGANGQYYDNGRNRELFHKHVAAANAQGIKVTIAKPLKARSSDVIYALKMENIAAVASMTRQATACLSLIIEAGKQDGIAENELAELLRQNGFKLNTKQDPWKIFHYYKKDFIAAGVLEVK